MLEERLAGLLEELVPDAVPAAVTLRFDGDGGASCTCNVPSPSRGGTGLGSPAPLFLAYSCTKTIVATLIVRLCETGRLSVDDPVGRWFPALPASSAITIRHLLNHTSGLPDYGALPEYHRAVKASPSAPWTTEQFLERTLARGLLFQPGNGWSYSNIGYLLLKEIAEGEEGSTLRALVAQRICRPLGLRETFVAETVEDLGALQPAPSKLVGAEGEVDVRSVYHPGWVSHGVVASTPADLAQFYHRLCTGGILSAAMLAQMTTLTPVPGAPPRYRNACYGLGLMADGASPFGLILGHNGGGPGYQASAFHAPSLAGSPVTACAMCATEQEGLSERLVYAALATAASGRP